METLTSSDLRERLAGYEIDVERGFLPSQDPLQRLPTEFESWELVAQSLPKLIVSDRVRGFIEALPPFPADDLRDLRELRRAMLLLSYLGQTYMWGQKPVVDSIPTVLSKPWFAVAHKLGRPPILSYASYALDNWYRLDPAGPIECGNIALIQNFQGGIDEEWFILIHVDIEHKAARALRALFPAQQATIENRPGDLLYHLREIDGALETMFSVLERMPEHCDPYVYFNRVRPYIHGWKNNPATPNGVRYEGVDAYGGQPQLFRGETGAQSAIIPSLDAVLGVYHADDPLKQYLLEMRDYMPPKHRAFIEALEAGPSMRQYIGEAQPRNIELLAAYDQCVGWVERFRTLHLEYAARYIFSQVQKEASNPSAVGTGGTEFMKYLKKHRDETSEHVMGA